MRSLLSSRELDRVVVGIDVHKSSYHLTALRNGLVIESWSTSHQSGRSLAQSFRRRFPQTEILCGYEAGCFGFALVRELEAEQIPCLVVHPPDIPTTNKQRLVKRDSVDSLKLAKALESGLVDGIYIPSLVQEGDRDLVRDRNRATSDLRRVKHKIKSRLLRYSIFPPDDIDERYWSRTYKQWLRTIDLGSSSGTDAFRMLLDSLDQAHMHRTKLDLALRTLARQERFASDMKLLRSIPGFGPVISMSLLVEIAPIGRFASPDLLASFLGLVPTEHSSGETERVGSMTPRRHKALRSLMIEAAWVARRVDPAMQQIYELHRANKPAAKAIVVVARKLSNSMHAILTKHEPYRRLPIELKPD